MNVQFVRRAVPAALVVVIAGLGLALPANAAESDARHNSDESFSNLFKGSIPAEQLPNATVAHIRSLAKSGTTVLSASSAVYAAATNEPSDIVTSYGPSPCYLTIILTTGFGEVTSESMTACTTGAPTTTLHDMDIIKKDAVFKTTANVASNDFSNGFGNFISRITYHCPNLNQSSFRGHTGGQILFNGTVYGTVGDTGDYEDANCG